MNGRAYWKVNGRANLRRCAHCFLIDPARFKSTTFFARKPAISSRFATTNYNPWLKTASLRTTRVIQQGLDMTESNTRTFFVLATSLVALSAVVQLAGKAGPAPAAFKASALAVMEPMVARTSAIVALPIGKCAVSWTNGGNYVLATPSGCNGVSVQAMTIRASAKSCADSSQADFRSLANSTYFRGDFGFYLGQDASARCLVVEQMLGRYL